MNLESLLLFIGFATLTIASAPKVWRGLTDEEAQRDPPAPMWPLSQLAWDRFSRGLPTLFVATAAGVVPILGLDAFGLLSHAVFQDLLAFFAVILVGGYALAGFVAVSGHPVRLVPKNLRQLP